MYTEQETSRGSLIQSSFFVNDSGELSLVERSSLSQPLFYQGSTGIQTAVETSFPFLLRGVQPIVFDTESGNYLLQDKERGTVAQCLRSVKRERDVIDNYISEIESSLPWGSEGYRDGSYFNLVMRLASRIPPMHEDCRISCVIPVYNEERVIKQTLDEYSYQNFDTAKYEIIFVIVGREGYSKDQTHTIIAQWINENRYAPYRLLDIEVPRGFDNVGFSRKLGHDVAFLRSIKRERQAGPLYFLCDDADCLSVDHNLLRNVVRRLDNHPETDALKRSVVRDPRVLTKHDVLHIERALTHLTEFAFFRRYAHKFSDPLLYYTDRKMTDAQFWLRTQTCGGDLAISAEALALIRGGFEPVKRSEDLILGAKLAVLRGLPTSLGILLNSKSVQTMSTRSAQSARRMEAILSRKIESGTFTMSAFHNFGDEEFTAFLREDAGIQSPEYLKFSQLDNLKDYELCEVVDSLLEYYTKKFFLYVFPARRFEACKLYAAFLSCFLGGRAGAFSADETDVRLADPQALRETVKLQRERYAQGLFRYQRCMVTLRT